MLSMKTTTTAKSTWIAAKYLLIGIIIGGLCVLSTIMQQVTEASYLTMNNVYEIEQSQTPLAMKCSQITKTQSPNSLVNQTGNNSEHAHDEVEKVRNKMSVHNPKIRQLENFRSHCWINRNIATDLKLSKNNPYFLAFQKIRYAPNTKILQHKQSTLREAARKKGIVKCMPYALLGGFPKCGTTDLYFKLAFHPDVHRPEIKEPHFWTRGRYGVDGRFGERPVVANFDNYLQLYVESTTFIVGERTEKGYHNGVFVDASASTIWDNEMWQQIPGNVGLTEPKYLNAHHIQQFMPDIRMIVIMRNPVDRLYSDFTYFTGEMNAKTFNESAASALRGMQQCLQKKPLRACAYPTAEMKEKYNFKNCRLHVGLYAVFIKDWLAILPENRFFYLRLEDYSKNKAKYLNQVAKFLGLDKFPRNIAKLLNNPGTKRKNSQRKHEDMLPETSKMLKEFYAPFNEELTKLLGDNRFRWNS